MAPAKGTKRGVPSPPAEKEAKKPKTDPLVLGVLDAVRQAEGLTEECRAMIAAGVPGCFATPAAERHEHQAMLISWINRIMDGVQARLKEDVDAADAGEAEAEVKRRELEGKVEEAKAALAAEEESVAAKEASLKEASEAAASAKAGLQEKQEAQRLGDAASEKATKEKGELDKLLEAEVASLKQEEGYDPKQAAQHMKSLLPVGKRLGVDDSLLAALQPAAAKPPSERGVFDRTVLEELEGSVRKKVAELEGQLQAEVPAKEERAASVATAQGALVATEEAHEAAKVALAAAKASRGQAVGGLADARGATEAFARERSTVATAREEKAAALQNFVGYNVECFQMLVNRAAPAGA